VGNVLGKGKDANWDRLRREVAMRKDMKMRQSAKKAARRRGGDD
jgi:hypothetical protein